MKSNFKKSQRVSYTANQDEEEEDEDRMKRRDHKKKPQGIAYFYALPNFLNIFYLNNFHPLVDENLSLKIFVSQPFFYIYLFSSSSSSSSSSLFTSAIHKSLSSYMLLLRVLHVDPKS